MPGSSTKEMGFGVSPDHHVPMGSVARLREYARRERSSSHYRDGPVVQLIARNRARHHRCIPGKENELRIACPRRDVLMSNYLASIQIRRLNTNAASFMDNLWHEKRRASDSAVVRSSGHPLVPPTGRDSRGSV